jgi:hypothetical protein
MKSSAPHPAKLSRDSAAGLELYLSGVTGIVEATRFERQSLCDRYALAFPEGEWEAFPYGITAQVGELAGMPVGIALQGVTVQGCKLVFVHATSIVVDHRLIDAWLDVHMPASARLSGRLNKVDAANFSGVFSPVTKPSVADGFYRMFARPNKHAVVALTPKTMAVAGTAVR